MLISSEEARNARSKLDRCFEDLQVIQKKMMAIRETGSPVAFSLYEEWEAAYNRFQNAHEEWKKLTPFRTSTETN
jgi:hypothetical protein